MEVNHQCALKVSWGMVEAKQLYGRKVKLSDEELPLKTPTLKETGGNQGRIFSIKLLRYEV